MVNFTENTYQNFLRALADKPKNGAELDNKLHYEDRVSDLVLSREELPEGWDKQFRKAVNECFQNQEAWKLIYLGQFMTRYRKDPALNITKLVVMALVVKEEIMSASASMPPSNVQELQYIFASLLPQDERAIANLSRERPYQAPKIF